MVLGCLSIVVLLSLSRPCRIYIRSGTAEVIHLFAGGYGRLLVRCYSG